MHVAMLRRTVLPREISSGKNPAIRENRTNSTLVRPPILIGLISIMMLILVSSTGHGGDVELKDGVKAMHTCSWSTGATDSVNEGTTAVETLSATSDSSGTCSYSIVGGVDSGDFSISGAALSFSSAPDYENPNDSNSDNIYSVQIRATDSADSATTDLTLSVTVNDLTLAITGSQSFSVLETASIGTEIGTITLSSDTADAWAILSGNTGSAFSLDSSNGVLTTAAGLDYETLSSYTLQVLAANGDESDIEAVTISVTNEGITVTDTSGNVQETASNGDSVVDVDATGDDDIALSWSITGGNTGTAFAIDNNGLITVNDASALNFESLTSYTLTVQATDSGSQTDTEDITISVLDVAPTVTDTSANLAETAAVSAAVVTVSTTGDTTSLTWSIASGN
ncbi:MAG: cadherin repeat domain-containing protein, partial [Candidatus Thalassarchaeaceae archaeon]